MTLKNCLLLSLAAALLFPAAALSDDDVPVFVSYEDGIDFDDEVGRNEPVEPQSDMETRIASLESQIAWLKGRQRNDVLGTLECQQACRAKGSGGLYGGVEMSFLRPYMSSVRWNNLGNPGKLTDPSYGTGLRFILGSRTDNGLGLCARYFTFNHGVDLTAPAPAGRIGIDVDAVDAETTLRGHLRNYDMEVSGGVRYGRLGYTFPGSAPVLAAGNLTFEGVGPTVAVDIRRQMGDSGLTLFGNLRGSLLLGEIRNGGPLRGPAIGSIEEEITQVIDNQLGIAWARTSDNGMELEIRAAWETQFWLNDTLADDVYGIGTNLALSGPNVAIEFRY